MKQSCSRLHYQRSDSHLAQHPVSRHSWIHSFAQKPSSFIHSILVSLILLLNSQALAYALDGTWVMANDLSLAGQPGWNYYNGGDAPEGAYMGWMYSGTTELAGQLRLPKPLSPGRYYGFVKLIAYSTGGRITFGTSASSGSVDTLNDDWNKYWTTRVTFDVSASTDTLTLRLIKTDPVTSTQKYLVRGIYITTNATEDLTQYGADRIAIYQPNQALDSSPEIKGNLLPDASFEAGLGYGWGFLAAGYYRNYTLKSMRSSDGAFDGTYSIKWPAKGVLYSSLVRLRSNRRYTLSMWVLSPQGGGSLWIENPAYIPPGYSAVTRLQATWNPSPSWQRVAVTGVLPAYPNKYFQIGISTNPGVLVDALQLEEGELSSFAPQNHLELGLSTAQIGNILYDDENPSIGLRVVNSSGQSISSSLHIRVYDYFNRKVADSQIPVQVSARSAIEQQFALARTRGIFRAVAHIEGQSADEELSFSVVQRPSTNAVDPDSMLGVHPNFSEYQLELLQRLGIKQARVLSPAGFFRWGSPSVEPSEGNIIWFDTEVDRARQRGFEILGTIGTNNYWPAWADVNGLPNLDKWEAFVEQLATHYRGRVKYWEIWNEPIYTFTPEFYAEMSKRAAAAIRRADPSAKIVGMGGTYRLSWIQSVLQALGPNPKQYFDFISTHQYPPNTDPSGGDTGLRAEEFRTAIIEGMGVEVWNTETGNWCEGFYKGNNSNFFPLGEPYDQSAMSARFHDGSYYRAEWTLENFLLSVGNGMSKYFYYDSRLYAAPNYLRSHPTMLEYDDSVRAKGVAYTAVGKLIDHSRGLGNVSGDSTVIAMLFERAGKPLVALWSKDGAQRQISIPLSDAKLYDAMGNEQPRIGSALLLGRLPSILISNTFTVEQARSAMLAIRSTIIADTTAPNLSIEVAARGLVKESQLLFRWIAHDEVSVPFGSNAALTYSYKIEGLPTDWSSWSGKTMLEIATPTAGTYRLLVRAKDAAGNVAEVASEPFTVPGSQLPSAPANLRVQ
jgi:hypothetical protein